MNTRPITLTVSQLNEYVGALLDSAELLSDIYIKGEISNFTNHYKTGHFYFTLKDEKGNLKAVMFRSNACRVRFVPQNGMKVTAHGRITVYERDGVYQLYCDELIPDGVGALYLAFEQLKEKLSGMGIFDEAHKKPIPRFPQKIGIVTSPTGAAIADMLNILRRRYPLCEIELYPALVQGDGAAKTLIDGLAYFDGKVDTVIIGRGGGSIEDLWAFNDEKLAMAIYNTETPVISAVGHEIDFTICDFAADLRAPTPSAAAELAVPDTEELYGLLGGYALRLDTAMMGKIVVLRESLKRISDSRFFKTPEAYLDKKRQELMMAEERFLLSADITLERHKARLAREATRLEALSPLAVLSRGYSVTYKDGRAVETVTGLSEGDHISIRFADGQAEAEIKSTQKL